jgi:hypothetical protein
LAKIKAFLKKFFNIREKTAYERKLRFNYNSPSLSSQRDLEEEFLRIRGINAARKLEELKEARKEQEN